MAKKIICEKRHIEDLPEFLDYHVIYQEVNGEIFVSWASVTQMLNQLGLEKHANKFVKRIIGIKFNKK